MRTRQPAKRLGRAGPKRAADQQWNAV